MILVQGIGDAIPASAYVVGSGPPPPPPANRVSSLGKAPVYVKSIKRVGESMTAEQRAAVLANQGICNQAADSLARNSPVAPKLVAQCGQNRRANILAGMYYVDAMSPNDPAYRVALTDAGEAVIARDPTLAQIRAQIPLDPDGDVQQRRGFTMAQGVRAGSIDPNFPSWVTQAMTGLLLKGFTEGLQGGPALEIDQATRPSEDAIDGIPKPVLIGGGIALAAALGLVAYKLTRK